MISWIKDELKASLTRRSHRSRHRHSAPSLIFAPFLSSSFGSPSSSSSSPSSLVPSVNYKVLMRRLILEKDTGCLEGTVIHYAAIAPSESTSKTIETLLECFPRNGKSRKRLLLTSRAKDGSLPLNWSSGSQGNISSLKTLLKVSIECLQQQKKEQKQELENNWKKEKTNRLSSFFRQRILTELEGQEEDMKDAYEEEEGDEEEEEEVEEEEEEELSDDPNLVFVDDMGFTPLHRVAELTKEAEERIRMLLEAGFRTDMKNKKGELPYDVTLARIGRFCRTSKSPMALLLKPKQSLQLQPSRLTSNGG